MIPRIQQQQLQEAIKSSRIVLVRGPRNVGKLQLVHEAAEAENLTQQTMDCRSKKVDDEIGDWIDSIEDLTDTIILYEAQFLENLQSIVEKAFSGELKQSLVIICSFEPQLDEELMEALKLEELDFKIFAPSFYEAAQHFGLPQEEKLLEERLIFGNNPKVLDDLEHAPVTLRELIHDVIHTKLGAKDRINKGDKLLRVMQVLAFEIGEPVSYNDIGERCGIDNETVERYIDLLEQAFVLIRLPSYHTEQRYELKKSHCIYFQDNGIRNALIENFNPTFLRNDMLQLWKNYMVSERVKWLRMNNRTNDVYFWRTHTRQQIDYLEMGEEMMGYKMDWEKRKKVKIPNMFSECYPDAKAIVLNRSSYWSFLTRKK